MRVTLLTSLVVLINFRVGTVIHSRTVLTTGESELHGQTDEVHGTRYSPTHICATWDGTGSVEDASRALGFSRAKGYDLVRRGEFPCRVLRIGRTTRVVTASLLRVLESGEPEYNGALAGH
ncbi:putative DNA-binding transcriptional regulator AlpA [Streptomyces achromogenes]|uniref:DNA-binding transcriptional regulator AlpA n=1 Tax=Streptomyces achromogenes TaxID=67255 RepID=A0ABU0Q9S8_STRAH|nr:helix-turn-helix domain-containing protein [Streptomyces achromogenes]MDQ0687106.1 putative DNA-binding transcriptional regulator AlpA [Streptomyces achromogenes]